MTDREKQIFAMGINFAARVAQDNNCPTCSQGLLILNALAYPFTDLKGFELIDEIKVAFAHLFEQVTELPN